MRTYSCYAITENTNDKSLIKDFVYNKISYSCTFPQRFYHFWGFANFLPSLEYFLRYSSANVPAQS